MPIDEAPTWRQGWQIFIAFVSALLLFQIVLLFMGTTDGPTSTGAAFALLGIGALSVFVMAPIIERRALLDCASETTLAASYRTRFFLRIAFAESAALFGFVGFFIANLWWVYPASLVLAAVGFLRLAPTRANLAEDQRLLRDRGCNLSLVAALRQPNTA